MRKRIRILIYFIIAVFCLIMLLKGALGSYLLPLQLSYCQGLSLKYLPYRSEDIYLKQIRKQDLRKYGKEYQNTDVIWIGFEASLDKYYNEANRILHDLWIETDTYLDNHSTNKLNNEHIDLYIAFLGEITGICNYDTRNGTLLEDKWVYYDGTLLNWADVNMFSDVYGIECYMRDITDIENIENDGWKNLVFLHIRTSNEQEVKDEIKEKLMERFPGVEITIE